MKDLKITRADLVTGIDVRMGIARIFGEGFAQWLGFFSKNPATIAAAFAHAFQLDRFYVAVSGGEVAGMAACTDCRCVSMRLDSRELRKHFGWYKGSIAGIALKKEFEAPFLDQPPRAGSIEFVGTSSKYRGQGVATQILRTIIETAGFETYLIEEVADTNIPAMNLYSKLGFVEYKSKPVPEKRRKKLGINRFVSLRYAPGR